MFKNTSHTTHTQPKTVVYIAHPIGGDVEGNLAKIRKIVKSIYNNPKYATVVPLVPYYLDVLLLNDEVPAERQRGTQNGLYLLSKKGMIDEVWLCGNRITEGMKAEVFAAFQSKITVCAFNGLADELYKLTEQWEKR